MSLRAAILGGGFMGKTHAEAFEEIEGVDRVVVVDSKARDSEYREEFGAASAYYETWEALREAEDFDFVDICLPTFLHEEYVQKALSASKPIFCEKPLALNEDQARRIAASVREAGVPFMVGHVLRFWPEYVRIEEVLREGDLGAPHTAVAHRLAQRPDWGSWFRDPEKSGGAVLDLHIHDLDFFNWLFGPPESIYARGQTSDTGAWDHVLSSVTYGSVNAFVEGSFMLPEGYPFTMQARILCENGCVEFIFRAGVNVEERGTTEPNLTVYRPGSDPELLSVPEGDPYTRELEYFVEQLQEDSPFERITVDDAVLAVRTARAARESAESNRVVTV